jgi:hypothetical protein
MRRTITNSLKKEVCYFRLGYYDGNLSIPFIGTLFFLGQDIFGAASDVWFFQRAQCYLDEASADTIDECERAGIIELSSDDLEDIVDWEGLLSELAENNKMQDEGKFLFQRR